VSLLQTVVCVEKFIWEDLKKRQEAALFSSLYESLKQAVAPVGLMRAACSRLCKFLAANEISDMGKIDYPLRCLYEAYLQDTIASSKVLEYVKAMDRAKLYALEQQEQASAFSNRPLPFREEQIFLLYYPCTTIARSFYYIRDKEELLWDFTLPVSLKLRKQIHFLLMKALHEVPDHHRRRNEYLMPLKWLYEYCQKMGIEDLELLEEAHVEGFRTYVGSKRKLVDNAMEIVGRSCKPLFLEAKKTNWDANVWYLERFRLSDDRMNPSNMTYSISFRRVQSRESRTYLKVFMKNEIGISNRSMCTVRWNFYVVLEFLCFLDERNRRLGEIEATDMEAYFRSLETKTSKPATFNKKVVTLHQFFRFLKMKRKITGIPFLPEYYLKSELLQHHNRSVSNEDVKKILTNLYRFPMHLRLMFLHLWCLGLRLNEVCTLQGKAYEKRGEIPYLVVYQYKMRSEKRIPIPDMLYRLMDWYKKERGIGPEDFVFANKKGGAYCVGTFQKQMKAYIEKCGIEDYHFKSHDYRHTVATFLYVHGASVQAVRDYLGHEEEDMTLQYLDYMQNQVEEANREYYEDEEHCLAWTVKNGE